MHFTYKYRCMVNRLEMSTFKTSLNWFGDVDVPEIWASLCGKPPSVIQFMWRGCGLGRNDLWGGGRGWRDAKR